MIFKNNFIIYMVLIFIVSLGLIYSDINFKDSFLYIFIVLLFISLTVNLYLTNGKSERAPSWKNLYYFILNNNFKKYNFNAKQIDLSNFSEDFNFKKDFWSYFPLILFIISLLLGVIFFILNSNEKEGNYIILIFYSIFMIESFPSVVWPFIYNDKKSKILAIINVLLYLPFTIIVLSILLIGYFFS